MAAGHHFGFGYLHPKEQQTMPEVEEMNICFCFGISPNQQTRVPYLHSTWVTSATAREKRNKHTVLPSQIQDDQPRR